MEVVAFISRLWTAKKAKMDSGHIGREPERPCSILPTSARSDTPPFGAPAGRFVGAHETVCPSFARRLRKKTLTLCSPNCNRSWAGS